MTPLLFLVNLGLEKRSESNDEYSSKLRAWSKEKFRPNKGILFRNSRTGYDRVYNAWADAYEGKPLTKKQKRQILMRNPGGLAGQRVISGIKDPKKQKALKAIYDDLYSNRDKYLTVD